MLIIRLEVLAIIGFKRGAKPVAVAASAELRAKKSHPKVVLFNVSQL